MNQNSSNERRQDFRISQNIPLKISSEKGGDFVTETFNISRSGAYCQVNEYVEPMTKLKISFLIPVQSAKTSDKKVTCGGVVVRTEPSDLEEKYNIAIFFNEINERDRELISDYIRDKVDS